ncbi:MAG TPA: tetratricopeptide repeat protein [Dissulfurispiraceae bacterium]
MRNLRSYGYDKKTGAVAASAAVTTFLVYLPALWNGFVNWDDPDYVYSNPRILHLDLQFLKWAFTTFHASNWHPLTWLSHAADYALWGLNPMGHHLSSILLHALNTFLVVILSTRLIRLALPQGEREEGGRGALLAGALTGLLFGLHPLHVESVAWVSERKDVLCAFFFLLSMLQYLTYAAAAQGSGRRRHYASSLSLFALALLSKPMAVSLPVVLLILDVYPLGRLQGKTALTSQRRVLLEKVPFVLLAAASSMVTIAAQNAGGAIMSSEVYPFGERFWVALRGLFFYLLNMLWPSGLSPMYPYPSGVEVWRIEYMGALMAAIGITVFCILMWKRQKAFASAWAYYTVALLPVLGIVQVGGQAAADRYTYLPSLGPFLLLGVGAARLSDIARKERSRIRSILTNAVVCTIIVVMAAATVQQTAIWKDSMALWTKAINLSPEQAYIAYYNRGRHFAVAGAYQKAAEDYGKALQIKPRFARAAYSLGVVHDYYFKNYPEALQCYSRAIEINPYYAKAYNNRGAVYATLGDYLRAIEDFNNAIRLDGQDADAYYNRGMAYKMLNEHDEAARDFQIAVQMGNEQAQLFLGPMGSDR